MKKTYLISFISLVCIQFINIESVIAQTSGIESGSIYKLFSKGSTKLLNSSNSGLDNSNNVDIWTDTDSDAEQWKVVHLGNSVYTFQNVGTGKYLHINSLVPANFVNVDQYNNTNDNQVKWTVVINNDASYTLQSAANTNFSMDVNNAGTIDGTNVQLYANNTSNSQKWTFEKVSARPEAPTQAIADTVFSAWNAKYDILHDKGFWGTAEMFEIILDAYETSGSAKYKALIDQMYNNFVANHGTNWMSNAFNDDIMWMTIACARAYQYTGNQTYLDRATVHFDQVYGRAWTSSYGGGMLWKVGLTTKNSCVNGPAIVAACYLYEATGNSAYLTKAQNIYAWQRTTLFNSATGAVWDSYDGSDKINYWSSTYNQGTFLGAAVMLFNATKTQSYNDDAVKIANYTRINMSGDNVINYEDGNDLEGFKGILMRYARRYVVDLNKNDYITWLKKNAKVAYNNRNTQNIISTLWRTRATEINSYDAFNTSSAVSLLINCPKVNSVVKAAFSNIQAEDFDYIKGAIVENCPDETYNLGKIVNGNYAGYNNIDFNGLIASKVELRVSNGTDVTSTIEIHLGGPGGTLIGTAPIPPAGGWDIYTTISCDITNISGSKNVYLVFKSTDYCANINYFKFIQGSGTTGLSEINNNTGNGISIYPIPVHDILNIRGVNERAVIEIFSVAGNRVRVTNSASIDVNNLESGVYLLKITSGGKTESTKFIKE